MKKFLLLTVLILFFNGCDESFDPKKNFTEKYLLYSIIKADSSLQVAMIAKSFEVDGFNPGLYQGNPFEAGSTVSIYNSRTRETTLLSDTSAMVLPQFPGETPFYKAERVNPRANDTITMVAVTPNGSTLVGKTVIPPPPVLRLSNSQITTVTNDPNRTTWDVSWTIQGDFIFVPKLTLFYATDKNGVVKGYRIEIPLTYIDSDNGRIPFYPSSTRARGLSFDFEVIDDIMAQISEGDMDKFSYVIQDAVFELLILDNNLANYYSSTEGFLDEFSVRLDEVTYSNVEGGLGVVGSTSVITRKVNIEANYVQGFGYRSRL